MTTTTISGRQTNIPHGTFYSLTTQRISNTAATQKVALEADVDVHLLTHSTVTNNSRITVQLAGAYEVIFSGIADIASGAGNKHVEVWLAVDGSPVTDSNTRVELPTISIETTVAVAYIIDLTAGQYVEMETWGDATTIGWLATAAGALPTRPATPSVIVTMKMISGVT